MDRYQFSENTMEQIYAGWLGKVIGIRLGAPVEGWTAEKIADVYGETWSYPVDYHIFAADDDSNGPIFFIRALKDSGHGEALTAQDVAEALLNYAPYEHGFFWWGGYGVSTEHTAYLNLQKGISAPLSGSIVKNGSAIAEQIGGQIFIDSWGLVAPGNTDLAAKLAERAASVTHDRNGIYGGIFIAVCISAAFTGCTIREMLDLSLSYIPEDSEYARAVRAVRTFYENDASGDWRSAFRYVKENFGYDRYPGYCHIIPNAAVIILALLYGEDDFTKTLCIGNMCGWDTDCNVGNLGAIMGVRKGLKGIDYDRWRKPVNDLLLCSGVMGSLNIMDVPYGAMYMAERAFELAGEELPGIWKELLTDRTERCHFEFPGSTHAMRVRCGEGIYTSHPEYHLRNTDETAASGRRSLKMHVYPLCCGQKVYLYQKTWYEHAELHDDRYQPAFSPKIYPGQRMSAWVRVPEEEKAVQVCMYVLDQRENREYTGEKTVLKAGGWTKLEFCIPPMEGALLSEAGVRFVVPGDKNEQQDFTAYIDDLEYGGDPDYTVDFAKERELMLPMGHCEITQFTRLKGSSFLEENVLHLTAEDYGEVYTGSHLFKNYTVKTVLEPLCGDGHFVNVRVQGGLRSYAVGFGLKERLGLWKNEHGYRELISVPYKWKYGECYALTVVVKDHIISVIDGEGKELIRYADKEHPYLSGAVGFSVSEAGHLAVHRLEVRPV